MNPRTFQNRRGTYTAVIPMLFMFLLAPAQTALGQDVTTVENGSRGSMRRGPAITEQLVIGQEGPEESLLFRPNGILFSPDGAVLIPDAGNHAILVYDLDGAFLRRIGGQGSGPGEFQIPMGAYFSWEGELVVPDPVNQRTSYFSPDGTYLRSAGLGTDGMIVLGRELIKAKPGEYVKSGAGAGFFVMTSNAGGGGGSDMPEQGLIEIVDGTGSTLRRFGEEKTHDDMQVAGLLNNVSIAYTPTGKVVLAYRYSNEFLVYESATGELELKYTRRTTFNPREPEVDMVENISPDGTEVSLMLQPLADEVTADITCDSEGRIWAITFLVDDEEAQQKEEDEEYEGLMQLEVFSPEGEFLAAVPLAQPATMIRFDEAGNLWTLDERYTLIARKYEVDWPR
ncbi:6-bladed beta-propeller [Candidatus Zixiibacteriota bacterium]